MRKTIISLGDTVKIGNEIYMCSELPTMQNCELAKFSVFEQQGNRMTLIKEDVIHTAESFQRFINSNSNKRYSIAFDK